MVYTEFDPNVKTHPMEGCRAALPRNLNLKNTDFVDTMISKVLLDLQPKSVTEIEL
jgi:hypothetical protein